MISFTSVMSSLLAVALAIFVAQMATELDEELNACGTGVFKNGKCECVSPYTGTHCELVDCGFGELIDSQFLIESITTPRYENERKITPGCKCDSKFWGYNCANCTTTDPTDCTGFCKSNYYGSRCEILCKESDAEDEVGNDHADAGGIFNFYMENPGEPYGLCQYDGTVKCREGRAGKHCEIGCKACVYGSCNLDDGTCDCFDGYYGELCDKTCPGRCSGKNGICQSDGTCKCEPGFTGTNETADCSLECCVRDFGTDIGTVHGDCKVGGGCECDEGWSGDQCDCNADITCSGRGTCSDGRCVCSPEFQGARCEMCNDTRVGPFCEHDRYQCPSNEVKNGEFVAVNSHGDYACKCDAGFAGDHCEMCTPSAYPKSGPIMCTYIVPASLCNRGKVKDDFAGSGVMCDCDINFDSGTDCQNCKSKYFGPDCDIFCDVQCSNSGGTCVNYPEPGCLCPPGKTNVDGICVVCGGDSECVHGECFRGRCQCDPGYYGDDCNTSAPIFKGKVCNGYTPVLKFETVTCDTSEDCTSTDSLNLANREVAYRAQQYDREMFCHRLDTPLELKDETGCCVDENFDGKCDKDMLRDQICSEGEIVVDICNERVLEGEVNVFEWCLSQERNCTKNGECVDPDLCENRCDLGLNASDWVGRWERDHIKNMASLMSETWKFPIHFPDPYEYRKSYIYKNPCPGTHPYLGGPYYGNQYWCYVDDSNHNMGVCNMYNSGVPPPEGGAWGANQPDCILNTTSTLPVPALDANINDICVSGTDYDTCRDYLIPDARVFNMTHMYVDGWKPLPTFETCKFGRYLFATDVNGTKTVQLEAPMYAGRIEVISDPRTSAAFARYQNGNESFPDANGDANTTIDSITFFGKGKVEVVVYNYTTEECADFIRKSAYDFNNCKRIQFYELDYSWSAFCDWRLTVSFEGGFNQRCYDQSKVCAGCEDYQEGCEGLPLKSEHAAPMPPPCNNYWDDFCDTYLNETAKPTGYCAYAECECDGYAIGGDACNLQCPVPQFTGTEAPCGEDMDPPWGKCNPHIGAIAFGFEQGECDCYNGGSPSVGCAQVCEGEQDCSPDIDTPFSFETFNCSDIADVQSIEILSETEQRCHVNLRDSVCNYWRGRCECATPFTAFTILEEPIYFNRGSYRIALMQGYEIDEYAPFVKYVPPQESMLRLMKQNRLCADEYIYPEEEGLVCADEGVKKRNTDWTGDEDGKRCKDYTESNCRTVTLVKEGGYCNGHYSIIADGMWAPRLVSSDPLSDSDPAVECMNRCLAEFPETTHIYYNISDGTCGSCKSTCNSFSDMSSVDTYKISSLRYDDKIASSVACEENIEYDLKDMTKQECLEFGAFETSVSTSNSDASDVYDDGYEFKTGFRVFDFGKRERLFNLEIFDPGAYCKVKVAGPNGASKGLGCDGARSHTYEFNQGYCEANAGNFNEAHPGYNPNFEDEKLYYKTCCEWTGSECVDNADFKEGLYVLETLDASSMSEAFSSNSWSFVDFVGHGNNYIDLKSRFLRIRGIAYASVKVKLHLTTTDYVVSNTKQGCIQHESDVTYYDFKPDVYTTEKVECSYAFKTFGKCDVSYSKGVKSVHDCAEACREDGRVMFTMVSGECMCAADDCNDFSLTSDRMYYITDNDACGYKFRYKGNCSLQKEFTSIVDHKECRDKCHEEGYTSFRMPCTCLSMCTKGTGADIYHIQSGYTPHEFIEIKTKSCEHFGHKTINSKELCRNGSLALGYDYQEVEEYKYYTADSGTCEERIVTEAECKIAAVSLGYTDSVNSGSWNVQPGCTVNTGNNNVFLETGTSDTPCSPNDLCICKKSSVRKGKSSVSFLERIQQAVIYYDGASNANDCAAQYFIWDGESWMGSGVNGGAARKLTLSSDQSKFDCQYWNGIFRSSIEFDDVTYTYPKVESVAECKENCRQKFQPFSEVTTTGIFTDVNTCSKDSNKIKDVIPDICLGMRKSITDSRTEIGCDGARYSGGNHAQTYCEATHAFFQKGDPTYDSNLDSIGEYYKTCCKWEDNICKEKYIPDVCRHPIGSGNFGMTYPGCDGARWSDGSYASSYCDGSASDLNNKQKHYYSTCCVYEDSQCKEKYVDDVKQACVEEDCSHATPTAIYSDCEPSELEEFAYTLQSGGDCKYPVLTEDECEKAKSELDISYAVSTQSSNTKPPGCIYKHGEVIFNTDDPVLSCGYGDHRCICRVPLSWKKVEKSKTCVCSDREVGPTYVFLETGKRCKWIADPPGTLDSDTNYVTFLDSSHPLASADRAQECANRCHAAGYSHFFVKTTLDGRCKCAQDDCSERTDQADATSYAISTSSERIQSGVDRAQDYAEFTDKGESVDISIYDTSSTNYAKGCSGGVYYMDPSKTECENCICLKGETLYRSDYVEVKSRTCEDHGLYRIRTLQKCLDALEDLDFDTKNLAELYFTQTPQYTDVPLGCAKHSERPFSYAGVAPCSDSQPCVCARRKDVNKYVLHHTGNCADIGAEEVTEEECAEAAVQLELSDTSVTLTGGRDDEDWPPKCYFSSYQNLRFNDPPGTGSCRSDRPCVCKNPTYITSDRYELKTSGTCQFELTSREECIAAAAIFGVLHNEYPENKFSNHLSRTICGVWSGYVHFGDATAQCSEVYPCLCRLEPPPIVFVAGDCEDFGLEHLDASECKSYATGNGFRKNSPCPANYPDLGGPYYGNQYWCYVDDTDHSLGICNMHNSGVPPPEGGAWGANQPDCHTGENVCIDKVQSVEDGRVCDENTGDLSKDSNSKGYLTVAGCADACMADNADGFHYKSSGCYCITGTIEGCQTRSSSFKQYKFFTDETCMYRQFTESTMPQNKCLYVNGMYRFNTGTSTSTCGERIPCVCRGKSSASVGSCPHGTVSRRLSSRRLSSRRLTYHDSSSSSSPSTSSSSSPSTSSSSSPSTSSSSSPSTSSSSTSSSSSSSSSYSPSPSSSSTSSSSSISETITLTYGDAVRISACPGTKINVVWTGSHNIQEVSSERCDSYSIGEEIIGFKNEGFSILFEADELTARPGQRRFFKCTSHCSASAARFEVYCPDIISRKYGFSNICFPTVKSTSKADREVITELENDVYKVEEIGSGMCAPDHDMFFHNRDNPYRVSDNKDIPDADACKLECLNTKGCTGFSFSSRPTYNYRSITKRDNRYIYDSAISSSAARELHYLNTNVKGNGVRVTSKINAVDCLQHCEEHLNRQSNIEYIPNSIAGNVIWNSGTTWSNYNRQQCLCVHPKTTRTWTGYAANYHSKEYIYTVSETTCVLSSDGCDKPILLGDGKCKVGDDHQGKTLEECENLCKDDIYCRTFSWKPISDFGQGYQFKSSGVCDSDAQILTASDCESAARDLGYDYHGQRTFHSHAKGCIFTNGGSTVYFNVAGVEDCSAQSYKCICKSYDENCRISGRECHYNSKRFDLAKDITGDDLPPNDSMEHDYVLLKVGVLDHSGADGHTNMPVCRGDCDANQCAQGLTCYQRNSADAPPPGCYNKNNMFHQGSGDDYCVYDEYLDGSNIKAELLQHEGSYGYLLPQVPTRLTCEENGWYSILDEKECMLAASLLLPEDTQNLLFEDELPMSHGSSKPAGCFYSDHSKLKFNTYREPGDSGYDKQAICKRGWKRYALGKTTIPGTRYKFTKKNKDLKPFHMASPLKLNEEYALIRRNTQLNTGDRGVTIFRDMKENPGVDYVSRVKYCAEACQKMSYASHEKTIFVTPSWKFANDRSRPVTGFAIVLDINYLGLCSCRESFSKGVSANNIANMRGDGFETHEWNIIPVEKEFLRRKEFTGGDPPWECHIGIIGASQSSTYDPNRPASLAFDNDMNTEHHTNNDANSWLQLDIVKGMRHIKDVRITNRNNNVERLGEFKIQWQKEGESTWTDCGTYTMTTHETKSFPCVVTSDKDISSVRIYKTSQNYLHIAEIRVRAPCGEYFVAHESYGEYITLGSIDDPTGRSRKCGEVCKSRGMKSFTVHVGTGHCTCFPNRWDDFGKDPFYNSFTKNYFRQDKVGTAVQKSKDLKFHHYEILSPRNFRNMHYGKGRYCGTLSSFQYVTGTFVEMQEACYELCQALKSFVLNEEGKCHCQDTAPTCNSFSGVTLTERDWKPSSTRECSKDYTEIGNFECTGGTERRMYAGDGSSDGPTNTYPDGTLVKDANAEKRIYECAAACEKAWPNYPGFIVAPTGRCYCEDGSSASCTRYTSTSYNRYDFNVAFNYDASRDLIIDRCAVECSNKGDYDGFVIPKLSGDRDTGATQNQCRCSNFFDTCPDTDNDWERYEFHQECEGDTYEHVTYTACLSICMDSDCQSFSYSGDKCIMCTGPTDLLHSRVQSSRVYQVTNANTYQQFEVLNEDPMLATPHHMGVPIFKSGRLEVAKGFKDCSVPFQLIQSRTCADMEGEPVASKTACELALAALGFSVTVTEVDFSDEPPGCYLFEGNQGRFNKNTDSKEASGTRQSVCEVPVLKPSKKQCEEYAQAEGLVFESEPDTPEFEFMCHLSADYELVTSGTCDQASSLAECETARVQLGLALPAAILNNPNLPSGCINSYSHTHYNVAQSDKDCGYSGYNCLCRKFMKVSWTPYKTTGICLENDFAEDIIHEGTYVHENFMNGTCMERKCEKVHYRWTKRTPGCSYKADTHAHQVNVINRGRSYEMHIDNCVDACVDMLASGKLGPVHTGTHKFIINRLRGSGSEGAQADAENHWTTSCGCLPLHATRFCDENRNAREIGKTDLTQSGGSYWGVTALPGSYDDIHSITVNAEIKCNYASVFRSFKEFERSVVTFQTAVDECFKACVTGSLFHRGGIASVGDMSINGFRVEKGTYSNEIRASCECVEIPETPEECEIQPAFTYKGTSVAFTDEPYKGISATTGLVSGSYVCMSGYELVTSQSDCQKAADFFVFGVMEANFITNAPTCSIHHYALKIYFNTNTNNYDQNTYFKPMCKKIGFTGSVPKGGFTKTMEECQQKCSADTSCQGIQYYDGRCIFMSSHDFTQDVTSPWEVYIKTGMPTYRWIDEENYCSEELDKNTNLNVANSAEGLQTSMDQCNNKDGCDGFSFHEGNNFDYENYQVLFANRGCGNRGNAEPYRWKSYVKEDMQTFKIKTNSESSSESKYTILNDEVEGSPVFFPKDNFSPQDTEEWFTHLDFTKYSIRETCEGKERVFDDECTHATSLFSEWQPQACPTGFTRVGDMCQKVEEIQNTQCTKLYSVDETVVKNLTFTGTNGNEDYLVSEGGRSSEDPTLIVCTNFQVIKEFSEHPLNIKGSDNVDVAENIMNTKSLTLQPGTYSYYCVTHPNFMIGNIIVRDCSPQPLFTEVTGNCVEECSKLAVKGLLGDHMDERYIVTHYASDCKCHRTGYTEVCSSANNTEPSDKSLYKIMTTAVNNCINDDEMICKEPPQEKSTDEDYICMSEEEVKVFDSLENCVVCGGGEPFKVGSVFFNENGDTRTCVYAEESSLCDEEAQGWSQYEKRLVFTSYRKVDDGYCENFKDMELDFSDMILTEMIESCATACKAYNQYTAFSISRTLCYCTTLDCQTRIGEFDTFEYETLQEESIDVAEIVRKWNSNAPGLRCFKDTQHAEEAPCDWIRALKHFARGASYRIGDCHNLAPGTDIDTQVPCNGHGFPSAGICACDYAENFELRSSGVGLTFEAPNLRQTPFRGKACEFMCPGYDMYNMDSVCSGHGRCETDGRCSCDQGFTGYNCHLACETETKALTCSGHGVCNERQQPIRRDIAATLNNLDCKNDTLYLARDRVIRDGDIIHYMYKSLDGLSIDSFLLPKDVTVDFKSVSNVSYKISVDGGDDEDNPQVTVCQTFTVIKSFSGNAFSIRRSTGEILAYNWDDVQQETLTATPGRYEYYSLDSPLTHKGFIDVIDCSTKSTRLATIDDFYIRGETVRRPFGTSSKYPYMPCKDRLNITRETAFHPLVKHTTPNVTVECSVLPGYQNEAYTILCGMCQCEESQATGFWTGYDCRTPAEGYFGKDGRDACPGLTADKKPCNGGGTCTWGSVDGLGKSPYIDAKCFCGDTTLDSTYATAPRNLEGDMMFHIMNFDDALYVDTLDIVDGNRTECYHGTVPINFQECQHDWVSNGGVETVVSEAAVVSDVRNTVELDFDGACDLPGTVIDQVKTEEKLVTGNKREQKMKCAGACFGEYKYIFDGRCPKGGVSVLNEDTNPGATWDEKAMFCSEACMKKSVPIIGEWSDTINPGFSIRQNGECVCDKELSSCSKIISDEWKRFDFVTPYTFIRTGSAPGNSFEVGPPEGDSDALRLAWCGSMCQHFVFDDQSIAKGFLYTNSNPDSCKCQSGGSDETPINDGQDRYDYTHFAGFTINYDVSCKCETYETCPVGTGVGVRFKILGTINPMPYTLEQRESIFDGEFICTKDELIQCKAGPLELTNYNQDDCSCKFGFTGNTCETPRMMCIFSGQETDGTSCICNLPDGTLNPEVRSAGCCTNGLYWDQIRYSSFSPIVDFDVIPNNIFYYDALKSVCKPGPMKLKSVSEGADAVRIHNYAALTDELYIKNPAVCNFPTTLSMYKAVYKYNAAVSETPTLKITKEEIKALGYEYDSLYDTYIEEYAKDRCLHRCTHRTLNEPNPFKSFHLSSVRTNLEEDTLLIGDNSDVLRTFDGSGYSEYFNPGNIDSNQYEQDEIEFCRRSCVEGPVSPINEYHNRDLFTQGYKASHFAVSTTGRCYCFAPRGGLRSTASTDWINYKKYNIIPDIEYDCTCREKPAFVGGNHGVNFVKPISKPNQKVYDIVYPRDKLAEKDLIKCFQSNNNLQHVDIRLEEDINLMTGIPASITPITLHIKGQKVKKNNAKNFSSCYTECDKETSQIVANSFLWGKKPQVPIVFAGNPVSPFTKLKHCWAHCTSDSDCEDGLVCVQRYKSASKVYAWPGCIEPDTDDQQWGSGDTLTNNENICYDPSYLTDECYCTVHDPDEPPCQSSFTSLGAGYCSNYKYLSAGAYPPLLNEGDLYYNADRRVECMNRCQAEFSDVKGFFTKTVNGEERCACAEGYCAERSGSSPYLSFSIEECESNIRPGFLMEEHTDYYKISTPKMIAENDVEYEDAMPVNPYTCGLESIVHQGDIISSTCDCPINDYEELFLEYEYEELTQKGLCRTFKQETLTVGQCENLCDSTYGCNSFSHPVSIKDNPGSTTTGQCNLAVDCDTDWDIREFASFFCYGQSYSSWTTINPTSTTEGCAEQTGTTQFAFSAEDQTCVKYNTEYLNMDGCTNDDGGSYTPDHLPVATSTNSITAYRNSITKILSDGPNRRNDWYYGNLHYKSYNILSEPNYDSGTHTRYVRRLETISKGTYCTVGEQEIYSVETTNVQANDHTCMQKCREEFPALEFVIARGETVGDQFKCLCSDFDPDDPNSGCAVNTFKGGKQYKVSNSPLESCKCPGFYIFENNAISCPPGKYSGLDDPCMSSCKSCPRGKFSQVGYTECESCPAGKIQEGLLCTDCPVGQSSPAGVNECLVCALGLYTEVKATPSCLDCPIGFFDDDGESGSSCKICPKGYFSGLATKNTCMECQPGRYGDQIGQGSCKGCPVGKYQPLFGTIFLSECIDCAAGYYQNQNGQSSCKACGLGKYQSQRGRTGCASCNSGQYQDQYGQSGCKSCPKGRYMPTTDSDSCFACTPGFYSDQTGRLTCKSCDKGKYNDQNGQTSSYACHNCPAGRYNGYYGQSSCEACGSLYPGYEWSNNPDRTTYDMSCDMYKTNLPSVSTMYYDDDYYCNFYGQMAGNADPRGDMWRRDCWMDPWKWAWGSNACNDYACKYYSDCTQSWTTKFYYSVSGYLAPVWYYCEASHDQQYD